MKDWLNNFLKDQERARTTIAFWCGGLGVIAFSLAVGAVLIFR